MPANRRLARHHAGCQPARVRGRGRGRGLGGEALSALLPQRCHDANRDAGLPNTGLGPRNNDNGTSAHAAELDYGRQLIANNAMMGWAKHGEPHA